MSRRGVCPSCGNDLGSGGDDCLTCSAFADGVRYATKLDADRAAELIATARDKALYDAIDVLRRTDRKMRRANYLCDASKCIEALQALRAAGEKKA